VRDTRGFRIDHALVEQVERDPRRRLRRALAGTRLQQVEHALLHGELEVLHVAEGALQAGGHVEQGLPHRGGDRGELVVAVRAAPAADHVLALRVEEEIHPWPRLAAARVAREAHARARQPAGVAEHHALHRDRGAHVVGQAVHRAVGARLVRMPGREHRGDRLAQLLVRILREGLAGFAPVGVEVAGGELAQRREVEHALVALAALATLAAHGLEVGVEMLRVDPGDHLAIAGDQAPVGIPGQARMAADAQQAGQRGLGEADVEQGLHHPRHRHRRTRAHRQQQRMARVAEAQPAQALQLGERRPPRGLGERAGFGTPSGADHEGRGHRQAERGHAREVPRLGAERLGAAIGGQGRVGVDQADDTTGVGRRGGGRRIGMRHHRTLLVVLRAHRPTPARLKTSRRRP
jgi:hypothetical protein